MPSGNTSWVYATYRNDNRFETQRNLTAVVLLGNWPYVAELEGPGDPPRDKWPTVDDFHVAIACATHNFKNETEDEEPPPLSTKTVDSWPSSTEESDPKSSDKESSAISKQGLTQRWVVLTAVSTTLFNACKIRL